MDSLLGYVYGDARRRGMRYVMWTLLAFFIPNGIGVILYFILRDPMPTYCSKCGASAKAAHAFCPRLRCQHIAGVRAMPPCRPTRLVSLRLVRGEIVDPYRSAFSMAAAMSGDSGVTLDSKRATTLPSLSTRNLVKFH